MIVPEGIWAVTFYDGGYPPDVQHIGIDQVVPVNFFHDRNDEMYIVAALSKEEALKLAEDKTGREPWDGKEGRQYHVVDGRWNSNPDGCAVLYSSGDIESSIRFRDEHTPDGLVLSFPMNYGQYRMSRGRVEVDSQGNRLTQDAERADTDE